jgi:hypothetical protein
MFTTPLVIGSIRERSLFDHLGDEIKTTQRVAEASQRERFDQVT